MRMTIVQAFEAWKAQRDSEVRENKCTACKSQDRDVCKAVETPEEFSAYLAWQHFNGNPAATTMLRCILDTEGRDALARCLTVGKESMRAKLHPVAQAGEVRPTQPPAKA